MFLKEFLNSTIQHNDKITINFRKWCEYKGYKPHDNRNGGSTKLSYSLQEKIEEEEEEDIWDGINRTVNKL